MDRTPSPWLQTLTKNARSAMFRFAPPGTLRHKALRNLARRSRARHFLDFDPGHYHLPSLECRWDRETLNDYLLPFGVRFPERPQTPTSTEGTARFILELLAAAPELRQRFPRALHDGPDGEFTAWLRSSQDPAKAFGSPRDFGITPEVAGWIEGELRRRPGLSVLHWYDHRPSFVTVPPLALTPAGRTWFLGWLLLNRHTLNLHADDILWFFFQQTEDPAQGLSLTFLREPDWQHAVPHGLTPEGWEPLRRWVASRYQITSRWLHLEAMCPTLSDPESQARDAAAPRLVLGIESRYGLDGSSSGVNILAHFRYPSGLQVAAENTVAALQTIGYHVSCRDVPTNGASDQRGRDGLLGLHPFPITISHLAPEPWAEDCYDRAGLAMWPDAYRIGAWYWELEEVPPRWKRHATWLHELWAPSRFIAEALRRVMPMPVVEMPPGIRFRDVVQMPRLRFGVADDRLLFLFMFDMESTIERKNPLAVIEAFRQAFGRDERVSLVIKISRGSCDMRGLASLQRHAEPGRIVILDEVMPAEDVAGLLGCCDAYVSLHRSEGFGLTMAEAMALGKPVIATAYSGNLDYMNSDNCLLVPYEMTPIRRSVHVYPKGATWAEPSVAAAAQHMRWIADNRAAAQTLGERAKASVLETLSLEAAGRRMAARIEELQVKRFAAKS